MKQKLNEDALVAAVLSLTERQKTLAGELSSLEAACSQAKKRLDAANIRVRKAGDFRSIMNLMSAHAHCCLSQEFEEELELYWSKRGDIVYCNGDLAYVGRKAIYAYYVGNARRLREQAVETAKRVYGHAAGGDKIPGYRNMNLLGTPYVEIAEDGMTAQGIWVAYSYMTRLGSGGEQEKQTVLSRYSGDFIREDDGWKIWHRRNYADLVIKAEPTGLQGVGGLGASVGGPANGRQITCLTGPGSSETPWAAVAAEPRIPRPYAAWAEELSYIQKEEA